MAASDNVLHLRFCGANDPGIVWEINEVYPWKKAMQKFYYHLMNFDLIYEKTFDLNLVQ